MPVSAPGRIYRGNITGTAAVRPMPPLHTGAEVSVRFAYDSKVR